MIKTLLVTGVAVAAAGANAALIIEPTPGNLPDTEIVLFNDPGLLEMGPVVEGILNQSRAIVEFRDAGEDLFTAAEGQARIEAVDGSFTALTTRMSDPSLGIAAYQFNINAIEDGSVEISLYEAGSVTLTESFAVKAAGENWFRIYGTDGEVMSQVSFSSSAEILDVRQNRIGAAPAPVPEPASIAALGIGLAMLLRRRTRK
ncbi:MAG: PEP-CTERM sorting domain-containing protein [Armatimonadota bacterium]|nr:PEP-CTERM sorting domain-containing protein [Armatimonadota bacterium]